MTFKEQLDQVFEYALNYCGCMDGEEMHKRQKAIRGFRIMLNARLLSRDGNISQDEEIPIRVSRRCSNCGGFGHNRTKCTKSVQEQIAELEATRPIR
jgi:hypothetical protein